MNAKIKADFKARFGHEYLTAVPGSALEAEMREPERVTVKDLRVGDRFRLLESPDIGPATLLSERDGPRLARIRALNRLGSEWTVSDGGPVEVISRADQSSRVLVQVGVPLGFHETQQAAAREIGKMLAVQEGGGWCLACGDLAPLGQTLCHRCPAATVPPAIKMLPPASASDTYAKMLDALKELSTNAHAKFTVDPEPAPRCPSCDSAAHLRKTDGGGWYCGGTCGGWHGASLTAPLVPMFAVAQWVRLKSGLVSQVMRVDIDQQRVSYVVRREYWSGGVRQHSAQESELTACGAPKDAGRELKVSVF